MKLRKKHAAEVSEYLHKRASAALLKTITEKRLPKLVQSDREKLLDTLMANTTRCFPAMLKGENAIACTCGEAEMEDSNGEEKVVG